MNNEEIHEYCISKPAVTEGFPFNDTALVFKVAGKMFALLDLSEDSFRYLMEKGTHYTNAHFQHAHTETPVGHAALFKGTFPAYNGIVAGNRFDMDKGRVIYNCEDDQQVGIQLVEVLN